MFWMKSVFNSSSLDSSDKIQAIHEEKPKPEDTKDDTRLEDDTTPQYIIESSLSVPPAKDSAKYSKDCGGYNKDSIVPSVPKYYESKTKSDFRIADIEDGADEGYEGEHPKPSKRWGLTKMFLRNWWNGNGIGCLLILIITIVVAITLSPLNSGKAIAISETITMRSAQSAVFQITEVLIRSNTTIHF
jgi:hypothetical protein